MISDTRALRGIVFLSFPVSGVPAHLVELQEVYPAFGPLGGDSAATAQLAAQV
jgi:hypothetical protein